MFKLSPQTRRVIVERAVQFELTNSEYVERTILAAEDRLKKLASANG